MKDLLMWILVLILLFLMAIYLMSRLSESQTNQIYARAHLVEAKSDANASWMSHALPYFLTAAVIIVASFAVVISLIVLVTGGLAIFGILEYFRNCREVDARAYEQKRLNRPIVIQFVGTSRRQVYKKLGAYDDSFIIDG